MILSAQSIRRPSWDEWYLSEAYKWAGRSRDPSTKVGAVIARPDRTCASVGYNDFPRGTSHEPEKYLDRELKLDLIVHAEDNAILNSCEPLKGYTLYATFHPCSRCAAKIAQKGISCVVIPDQEVPERWKKNTELAAITLANAGVEVRRINSVDAMNFDLLSFINRKKTHSLEAFGPGQRTAGVIDHIRKELCEIEADPTDIKEWADLMLLAFDGAWRAGHEPLAIVSAILAKQSINENRTWPDWRTADPNKAIEHVKDHHSRPVAAIMEPCK